MQHLTAGQALLELAAGHAHVSMVLQIIQAAARIICHTTYFVAGVCITFLRVVQAHTHACKPISNRGNAHKAWSPV